MSWKKTGGINHSSNFNVMRVQNSITNSSSFISELGETNTTTTVKSNLNFDNQASIQCTNNSLDDRGLVAFYTFTDISNNNNNKLIINSASYDYGNSNSIFDHSILNLEIIESKNTNDTPNNIYDNTKQPLIINPNINGQTVNDISVPDAILTEKQQFDHFNQFFRFDGSQNDKQCVSLQSKNTINFNNYLIQNKVVNDQDNEEIDMHIHTNNNNDWYSLTVSTWIRINKFDAGNDNETLPTGFLLFSIDDNYDGQDSNSNEPSIYFYAPGYQTSGAPQLYITKHPKNNNGTTNNATLESPDINIISETQIAYNIWNHIALVISGNTAYIYQNGILTTEHPIGNIHIPEKKIIINGTKFYNSNNNSFLNQNKTSQMNIDIVDYKIYNYGIDSNQIKKIYEHDNPFFNETTLFNIDKNTATFGNNTIVKNNLQVNNDALFYNNTKHFGMNETYNNAFITGTLGIGIQKPEFKLDVIGDIRTTGNIYIADSESNTNGIYFQNTNNNLNDTSQIYNATRFEERLLSNNTNELLISKKANDINDSIRIKTPNLFINTFNNFDASNNDPQHDSSNFVFTKQGFLGINNNDPKSTLHINGPIYIQNSNNIYNDTNQNINNDIILSSFENNTENATNNIAIGTNIFNYFDNDPSGSSPFIENNKQGTDIENNKQGTDIKNNIALGTNSLRKIKNGSDNISIGVNALSNSTNGDFNISIGNNSLNSSFGENNIALGMSSGTNSVLGDNNIFIGKDTGTGTSNNISGSYAFGHGTTIEKNNAMNISNSSKNLKVGINNSEPNYEFDVSGSLNVSKHLRINGSILQTTTVTDNTGNETQTIALENISNTGQSLLGDITYIGDLSTDTLSENLNSKDFDYIINSRNIKISNLPPDAARTEKMVSNHLKGNPNHSFVSIPDKPITFDGNIVFKDTFHIDRSITNKGFNVEENMIATFKDNVNVHKIFTVDNPSVIVKIDGVDTIKDTDPSGTFICDPSNNTSTFNGITIFNRNVEFTNECQNVTIQNLLTVNDDASFNSSFDVQGTLHCDPNAFDEDPNESQVPLPKTIITGASQLNGRVGINKYPLSNYQLDVSGDTHISGNIIVDGSFNFNNIIQHNIVEQDHKIIRNSERVVIHNSDTSDNLIIDAPALHVTQEGTSHNIAEFYDGDLSNNDIYNNNGLVLRIGNNRTSDIYGNFGINCVPSTNFDISGTSRFFVNDISGGAILITDNSNNINPRCSIDINTNDSIRIPVGDTSKRNNTPIHGMLRYNNEIDYLEYYGISNNMDFDICNNHIDDDQWARIAAGGRMSHNKNIYFDINEEEKLSIDTSGNIRIGNGRQKCNAKLQIDLENNESDILNIRHNNNDKFKTLFNSTISGNGNNSGDGQSFHIKTYESSGSNDTSFNTYDAISIIPNGNVGIGITSPSQKLELYDTSNCNLNIISGNNYNSSINLYNDTSGSHIEYNGSQNQTTIYHTGNTEQQKIRIDSYGNIGIGTEINTSNDTSNDKFKTEIQLYKKLSNTTNTQNNILRLSSQVSSSNYDQNSYLDFITKRDSLGGNDWTSASNRIQHSIYNISNNETHYSGFIDFNPQSSTEGNKGIALGTNNHKALLITDISDTNGNNQYCNLFINTNISGNNGALYINTPNDNAHTGITVFDNIKPCLFSSSDIVIGNGKNGYTNRGIVFKSTSNNINRIHTNGQNIDFTFVTTNPSPSNTITGLSVGKDQHIIKHTDNSYLTTITREDSTTITNKNNNDNNLIIQNNGETGNLSLKSGNTKLFSSQLHCGPNIYFYSANDLNTRTHDLTTTATSFKITRKDKTYDVIDYDSDEDIILRGRKIILRNKDNVTNQAYLNANGKFICDNGLTVNGGGTINSVDLSGCNMTKNSSIDISGSITTSDDISCNKINCSTIDCDQLNATNVAISIGIGQINTATSLATHDDPILFGKSGKYNVNAYIHVNGGSNGDKSIYAGGDITTAQNFIAASDRSIKENIITIDNALEKTNSLRGVYYNKINSNKKEIGVIAQEVEEVLPEVVSDIEGLKGVSYGNITALLIESIKELTNMNKQQQKEIDELKNTIQSIKNN